LSHWEKTISTNQYKQSNWGD